MARTTTSQFDNLYPASGQRENNRVLRTQVHARRCDDTESFRSKHECRGAAQFRCCFPLRHALVNCMSRKKDFIYIHGGKDEQNYIWNRYREIRGYSVHISPPPQPPTPVSLNEYSRRRLISTMPSSSQVYLLMRDISHKAPT